MTSQTAPQLARRNGRTAAIFALVALAFIPLIAWMPTRIHPPRAVA